MRIPHILPILLLAWLLPGPLSAGPPPVGEGRGEVPTRGAARASAARGRVAPPFEPSRASQGRNGGPVARLAAAPAGRARPAAGGPEPIPVEAPSAARRQQLSADELFSRAADYLERHPFIVAKVRQRARVYGQEAIGTGVYLQGPADSQWVRFELKTTIGNRVHSLEQVCDGQYLWLHSQLAGLPVELARVDVRRARELLSASRGSASPAWPLRVGLGGLPRLMGELDQSVQFEQVQMAREDDRACYRLSGKWTAAQWARLLPEQAEALAQGQPPKLDKLPEQTPDGVAVWLAQEDLFPVRFDFLRSAPTTFDSGFEDEVGAQVLLSLRLFEIRVLRRMDPERFAYAPGQSQFDDRTEEWIADQLPPGK